MSSNAKPISLIPSDQWPERYNSHEGVSRTLQPIQKEASEQSWTYEKKLCNKQVERNRRIKNIKSV